MAVISDPNFGDPFMEAENFAGYGNDYSSIVAPDIQSYGMPTLDNLPGVPQVQTAAPPNQFGMPTLDQIPGVPQAQLGLMSRIGNWFNNLPGPPGIGEPGYHPPGWSPDISNPGSLSAQGGGGGFQQQQQKQQPGLQGGQQGLPGMNNMGTMDYQSYFPTMNNMWQFPADYWGLGQPYGGLGGFGGFGMGQLGQQRQLRQSGLYNTSNDMMFDPNSMRGMI